MPLLLVRHAVALRRDEWSLPDHLRPLSPEGRAQAQALVDLLGGFGIDRILSSPAVRCIDSVEPLSRQLGIDIETVDELAEGAGAAAATLVDVASPATVLLCTHGDLVPELFGALVGDSPFDDRDFRCAKGSTWVIGRSGDAPKYLPPPTVG